MCDWARKELRANFARASRAGRAAAKAGPRAARALYQPGNVLLCIELTNGATSTMPVKLIPALKRAARIKVLSVQVLGRGGGLHWEKLDLDLSVPALVGSMLDSRPDKAPSRSRRRPLGQFWDSQIVTLRDIK
jgi:Protein of unknown function (DUF2442)